MHGNGRLGNLLERNGNRIVAGADGITNLDIRNTGYCNDGTDGSFVYFYFVQTFKFIKLVDLYFLGEGWIVMVYNGNFLVYAKSTVINLTNTDTANVFVIVDGTD